MEKSEFLKSVPLFSELDDDTLIKLSKTGSIKSYEKDSIILSESDAGSALFVLVSGKVKISRISSEESGKAHRKDNQIENMDTHGIGTKFGRRY